MSFNLHFFAALVDPVAMPNKDKIFVNTSIGTAAWSVVFKFWFMLNSYSYVTANAITLPLRSFLVPVFFVVLWPVYWLATSFISKRYDKYKLRKYLCAQKMKRWYRFSIKKLLRLVADITKRVPKFDVSKDYFFVVWHDLALSKAISSFDCWVLAILSIKI